MNVTKKQNHLEYYTAWGIGRWRLFEFWKFLVKER
jgi:hypothetical protein